MRNYKMHKSIDGQVRQEPDIGQEHVNCLVMKGFINETFLTL